MAAVKGFDSIAVNSTAFRLDCRVSTAASRLSRLDCRVSTAGSLCSNVLVALAHIFELEMLQALQ